MEEVIRALLRANADIAAYCAGRVHFGSYPEQAPYPGIVLNTISDTEGMTLDGPTGLPDARFQVDCYAKTYGEAKLLAREVRTLLSGYSEGSIQGVFYGVGRDMRDETAAGTALFRVSQDYTVRFNR